MIITVEYKHNHFAGFFIVEEKTGKKQSLSTKMWMKNTKMLDETNLHSKRQAQLTSHLFLPQAILMLV